MEAPEEILKRVWGYPSFRPLQEDIIQSVIDEKHTLALMPTGGGKSLCFQVPALSLEGIAIVVTPLIALMKDQVQQLQKRGVKAAALYSGMTAKEVDITLDNCVYGQYKLLYVSPERLQSELFLARVEKMNVSILAVDEAHCISQWGHDFRPPYLEIHQFIERFEITRLIALTASATKTVQDDIVKFLKFKEPAVFTKSYARPNLSYSVFKLENKEQKLLQVLNNVAGSAIVYAGSRKRTVVLADWLRKNGIAAEYYHAGLPSVQRTERQNRWMNNHTRVIVATNAFGMGIDKPDVRVVMHFDTPDSLEAYYQEAGRAGRDERKAYAVALYQEEDLLDMKDRIERSSVDIDLIKRVYQALANRYKLAIGSGEGMSFDFSYREFTEQFDLPVYETMFALRKLEGNGLIELSDGAFQLSKLMILITSQELYSFQVAHVHLDPLIKALLRLYGGELYVDHVQVKEAELARMINISSKKVVEELNLLDQYGVISYHEAQFGPRIGFVAPRLDANSLPIDQKELVKSKETHLTKFEKVEEYLRSETQCRTRMLQAYFGEETDENCGVCDFCLKKSDESVIEPDAIMSAIPDEGIEISDLWGTLGIADDSANDVLRKLVEKGEVVVDGANRVHKSD